MLEPVRRMHLPANAATSACLIALALGPAEGYAREAGQVLEEVIVSSRKLGDERLQDVPQSILAISSKQIQDFAIGGFDDYARLVPGLSFIDQGPGQSKLVLRGVSTGFTRADQVQDSETSGLYIDETPIAINGSNPDFSLFDVERIEVLRGPQGTLYGAGAMSGNVRIITKQPDPSEFAAAIDASFSNTKEGDFNHETQFMANVPLVADALALRVVGYHRFDDGFIDNVAPFEPIVGNYGNVANTDNIIDTPGSNENANWQEVFGGRAALKYFATEKLTATASIIWQKSELGGRFNTNESAVAPLPLRELEQFRVVEERTPDESRILNLTLNYDLGWSDVVLSTSFANRDWTISSDLTRLVDIVFGSLSEAPLLPPGEFAPIAPITNIASVEDLVQEARLSGSLSNARLSWVGGLFYSTRDRAYRQRLNSQGFEEQVRTVDPSFDLTDFGAESLGDFDTQLDLDQLAVFGELTYDVTDRLELTGGLRWFDVENKSDIVFKGLFQGGIDAEVNETKESGTNPKLSVAYRFSEDVLAFATASKGFRVGGTNEIIADTPQCLADLALLGRSEGPDSFDSDSLWNYEVGLKTSLLDSRLTLNATVYHIDWSDIQTTKALNCGFSFRENAGDATSDGVELEITAQPTSGLFVSFGGSYVKAQLDGDVPNLGGRDGDSMPYVPELNLNFMTHYSVALSASLEGFVTFSASHVGESFTSFDRAAGFHQPSYEIGNLRFGLQQERWRASIFIDNLWDERAAVFIQPNIFRFPPGTETNRNRPRTIGLSIGATF